MSVESSSTSTSSAVMTRSSALLAACGGDTVKVFDVNVDSGDPCVLSYAPSPGSLLNSVKWNHTNLVVASAGDDKKISLCRKNGQKIATFPLSRPDSGDTIDESICAISFSNKSSRYLCSGGTARVIRIWDLQRKLCIKKLSGHSDTITGVMYNFKDEHLASISLKGDLILHNLSSGARATELKDPKGQVLRVLDYSRFSRHVLVTAGDDGSLHLWDTTARTPKVSWLKQHSAPATGVCFSPSSDKIIASVGLDMKLYTYDSANKRSTYCAPYEAPFSSLAFRDDGNVLAAGTNSGRVVFYDIRGKPQPFTVLRAYNSSESVTSLCWQRSKPVIVDEDNCSSEIALLGGSGEDSVLMPDPLPSVAPNLSSASITSSRSLPLLSASGSVSTTVPVSNETPLQNNSWARGSLSKLQAPQTNFSFKDDMDVFSPLVDVQPIAPSPGSWWDSQTKGKKDEIYNDKMSSIFSTPIQKNQHAEAHIESHPISDWRSTVTSSQDDGSTLSPSRVTPMAPLKGESSSSPTPPAAWGGSTYADKLNNRHQATSMVSRPLPSGLMSSGSFSAGLQDLNVGVNHSFARSVTNPSLSVTNMQAKPSFSREIPSSFPETSALLSNATIPLGRKDFTVHASHEAPVSSSLTLPRRYSTYAERISSSSLPDGSATSSPKPKKTGMTTREDLATLLSKQDTVTMGGTTNLSVNGMISESQGDMTCSASHQHGNSSFLLQLVQRTLEETMGSMQQSIHEDVRNLHIELLRQFHAQEMEMSNLLNPILEKLDDLTREVSSLRKENQQLRQLL